RPGASAAGGQVEAVVGSPEAPAQYGQHVQSVCAGLDRDVGNERRVVGRAGRIGVRLKDELPRTAQGVVCVPVQALAGGRVDVPGAVVEQPEDLAVEQFG